MNEIADRRVAPQVFARQTKQVLIVCALCAAGLPSLAAGQVAPPETSVADREPASTDGFYLYVGPGVLLFDAGASVRISGVPAAGATVSIDPNPTLITEFGYRCGHLGASFTGGVPPLATVKGAGTLAPLGSLGRIRYGPTVLTAQYYFKRAGRFQPYVGGGPVFLLIFKNQDGAIQKLDVHNSVGAAIQAGAEYRLSRHWGLFADAKKAVLKTNATAALGGSSVAAHIGLDPTVLAAGLSYRF